MKSNLLVKAILAVLLAVALLTLMSGCLAYDGYEVYHALSSKAQDRPADQSKHGQNAQLAKHQDGGRQNENGG